MSEPTQSLYDAAWWELRQQECRAATLGGSTWQHFVKTCERRLGLPWNTIRKEFERIPQVSPYA